MACAYEKQSRDRQEALPRTRELAAPVVSLRGNTQIQMFDSRRPVGKRKRRPTLRSEISSQLPTRGAAIQRLHHLWWASRPMGTPLPVAARLHSRKAPQLRRAPAECWLKKAGARASFPVPIVPPSG